MHQEKPTYQELAKQVKELQDKLQDKKNDELTLLLDHVPILIWYMKDEETFGAVNKAFANFFGKEVNELQGRKVSYLVDDQTTDITISTNKIVFEQKKPFKRKDWITNKNGEKRLLKISKTPKIDENGNVKFVVCTAEDITEQERTKEILHENIEKYKLLFENSPVGILHYNEKGQITECNEALLELFDTNYDDIIPLDLFKIFYSPTMKKEFASTFHGKYAFYEGEFVTPFSKKKLFIKADFAPIFSDKGSINGGVGIIQDISKRMNTEQRLVESEKKFRELIENINDISWLIEDKEIIYMSPAFEKLLNIDRDELYKDASLQFKAIHPDDKGKVINTLKSREFVKNKKFNIKFRIITHNGEIRWLWARSYPIYDKNGNIYRIAGIASDITGRIE